MIRISCGTLWRGDLDWEGQLTNWTLEKGILKILKTKSTQHCSQLQWGPQLFKMGTWNIQMGTSNIQNGCLMLLKQTGWMRFSTVVAILKRLCVSFHSREVTEKTFIYPWPSKMRINLNSKCTNHPINRWFPFSSPSPEFLPTSTSMFSELCDSFIQSKQVKTGSSKWKYERYATFWHSCINLSCYWLLWHFQATPTLHQQDTWQE